MSEIFSGVLRFWNADRGFGFLIRDGVTHDRADDFVHASAVKREGEARR